MKAKAKNDEFENKEEECKQIFPTAKHGGVLPIPTLLGISQVIGWWRGGNCEGSKQQHNKASAGRTAMS